MLQITINGMPTAIFASELPEEITSLDVIFVTSPFEDYRIPVDLANTAKRWLYSIIDKCTCEYVTYNNILQNVDELKSIVDNLRSNDEQS